MKRSAVKFPSDANILLVDDNKHGLLARKTVLEEIGYRIKTATNGEEALEFISRENFDVVITDYKMPTMDGLELIRRIRGSRSAAPIILLSGFVEPLGLDEESSGADAVISKTAGELPKLIRAIHRLLSQRMAKKPATSQRAAPQTRASNA